MAAKDTQHTSFKAFVSSLRNKASGSSSPATSGQVVPLTDTIRTPNKSKGSDSFFFLLCFYRAFDEIKIQSTFVGLICHLTHVQFPLCLSFCYKFISFNMK